MPRSLAEYQRKRDFSKTPEPKGAPTPTGHQRFVVQKHWATRLHYDFRLEMEGVLVSWAIPKGPTLNPAERRLAAHVEDHPIDYFDFEGLIPKGEYGGGTVMVWDWGTYAMEESTDPAGALRQGELKFRLNGQKLHGRFALVRTRSDKDWLLIKKRDEAQDPNFDIEALSYSVKSGRTREQIEAGQDAVWSSRRDEAGGRIDLERARPAPMPSSLHPMMATLVDGPFDDERWLFEVKWDGFRVLTFVDNGSVRLQTRAGHSANDRYPELAGISRALTLKQAILDGEVVALDEQGRPSFQLLQNYGRERVPIQYVVYDLLYADGRLLYAVPLEDRKRMLQNVLRQSTLFRVSEHIVGEGRSFYQAARRNHLEGIIAKLRDSSYQPGMRSHAWLKIKTVRTQDVVIGGFTAPRAGRRYFGALIVGVREDGRLVYAGHVGGGFTEQTLKTVNEQLQPLVQTRCPFAGTPPRGNETPTWVKPQLVAEVKFADWTRDGKMRMPVFLGMRDDVDPRSVRREQPEDADRDRRKAEATVRPGRAGATAARVATRKAPTAAKGRIASNPPALRPKTPVARKRASRTVTTGSRPTPALTAIQDATVPPTPLSQAAARIAAKAGTKIRGATTTELQALDALQRDGFWSIGGRNVHLTNLDKALFPEDGLTKRDLIKYYVQVAPVLIPYFSRRPLSMNPHPDGIHGKSFWQKDKPDWAPDWIPTFRYRDEKSEKDWILVEEVATLAWLANHAVIDLHPWYSRVDKPEYPDWSVIDLDPAEGATFAQVVQVASVVKAALDHLELRATLKTTGQRGLHIYIPIERRYTLAESRGFVEKLAHTIAQLMPELITEVWEVRRRTGKIRIDYTQNVLNKTLAGPYSVRPVVHAPVSTPIRWDELNDPALRPDGWTMATIGTRLLEVGDLFAEALTLRQRLPRI